MRIKLVEGFKHHLDKEISKRLEDSVASGDTKQIIAVATEILTKAKAFFEPEAEDYIIDEADAIIEGFKKLSSESSDEELDMLLNQLYDFCDGYSISIAI